MGSAPSTPEWDGNASGSSMAAKGWFTSAGKRWMWSFHTSIEDRVTMAAIPSHWHRTGKKEERSTLAPGLLECLGSPPRQSLPSCKSKLSSELCKGLDPTRSPCCARGVKTSTRFCWQFPGLSPEGWESPIRSGNLPRAAATSVFGV